MVVAVAIHVIYGPPGSGKTTYVAQRRAPHDIVIDLDALAEALGSPDTHNHPNHIRQVAGAARAAAIRKALELDGDTWVNPPRPPRGATVAPEAPSDLGAAVSDWW